MISKLIALLDAATEAPASTMITLFDYDGDIIKCLRIWASVHELRIEHRVITGHGQSSDVFGVDLANNVHVAVHDQRSVRRTDGAKVDAEPDVDDGAMWSPV
jgi:hypothetical protein